MRVKQKFVSKWLSKIVLMIILFSMGLGGGWASTSEVPLQLEGDRLTGHLSQVSLRTVLEQLRKQLGITYEAPAEELDKIISIDLQQAPILPALAKILAPWDYAFTVNSAGHLQFLYVTPKAPPAEAVSEANDPSDAIPSNALAETSINPLQENKPEQGAEDADREDADRSLPYDREPAPMLPPSFSPLSSPPGEVPGEAPGLRAPMAGIPMTIQPVPSGTTMPIVPSSGGDGMKVTPATSPPDMPIIPATSYPPMEIQPVPDYLQEEMLRNIQH